MTLGAIDLPGSLAWVAAVPAPVQGTPLQVAGIIPNPGPDGSAWAFVSEDKSPTGLIMEVFGCSADIDQALPHGPARV